MGLFREFQLLETIFEHNDISLFIPSKNVTPMSNDITNYLLVILKDVKLKGKRTAKAKCVLFVWEFSAGNFFQMFE